MAGPATGRIGRIRRSVSRIRKKCRNATVAKTGVNPDQNQYPTETNEMTGLSLILVPRVTVPGVDWVVSTTRFEHRINKHAGYRTSGALLKL